MTLVEIVGNLYVENVVQRRQLEELTARNAQLEAQLAGAELAKGVAATDEKLVQNLKDASASDGQQLLQDLKDNEAVSV